MDGDDMCITPPSSLSLFAAEPSITPQSCCTFDYKIGRGTARLGGDRRSLMESSGSAQSIVEDDEFFEFRRNLVLRELQQMVNRYNDCFRRLQDTLGDLELLRSDNVHLADQNLRLAILIGDLESSAAAASYDPQRNADLAKGRTTLAVPPLPTILSTGSGSDSEEAVGKGYAYGASGVPKSISIRSNGFLASPCSGGEVGQRRRLRIPASPAAEVFKGDDGELEVEVYSQGEVKTELCSNWGDTGRCRYGRRCRFAHGAEELRPVIRHPRYKTQPCRMVGPSGGECPYGHRCHFRHSKPDTAAVSSNLGLLDG